MSTVNLSPGIHNVRIYAPNKEDDNFEISLNKKQNNKIHVEFYLTGLSKLKDPIDDNLNPFYLYVLLSFHNGGKDINFISSADIYCDEKILKQNNALFTTIVDVPGDLVYDEEDFLWNYYCLDIVYSPTSAEDGSDLYNLLRSEKLFSSKLNVIKEVDGNE